MTREAVEVEADAEVDGSEDTTHQEMKRMERREGDDYTCNGC